MLADKMIPIDHNIPIPTPRVTWNKYPFGEMEIGDSFLYRGLKDKIFTAASRAGSRHNKKFTIRAVKDGYRVWRVK